MQVIAVQNGYAYVKGWDSKHYGYFYNLIPEKDFNSEDIPEAGYLSDKYICYIKNVPNLFQNKISQTEKQ